MKKHITSIAALVAISAVIVTATTPAVGAVQSRVSKSCERTDFACLRQQARIVLRNEANILKKGDLQLIGLQINTLVNGDWYSGEEYHQELVKRHENLDRGGFRLRGQKISMDKFICVDIPGGLYECLSGVETQTTYSKLSPSTQKREIEVQTESLPQKFLFTDENADGFWLLSKRIPISADNLSSTHLALEPGDSIDETVQRNSSGQARAMRASAPKLNINQDFTLSEELAAETNTQNVLTGPNSLAPNGTYNRSAAVNYAVTWAQGRNPLYSEFGNDCTNFTSQALQAGGWGYETGWYRSNDAWWQNWLNQSWTWAGAENFWQHIYSGNRGTLVSSFCSLEPGDIISADWDGDLSVDHTMIVTRKVGCELYLSYHSTDRLNIAFRGLPQSANYWGWQITDTAH